MCCLRGSVASEPQEQQGHAVAGFDAQVALEEEWGDWLVSQRQALLTGVFPVIPEGQQSHRSPMQPTAAT